MAASQKLQEFANLIQFGISQSNKQVQQTGNVQTRLANIEQALRENQAPGWLQAPFSEAGARQWINTAGLAKGTAEKALSALTDIAQTAYLPVNSGTVQSGANYDKQDVGRLTNMANTNPHRSLPSQSESKRLRSRRVLCGIVILCPEGATQM